MADIFSEFFNANVLGIPFIVILAVFIVIVIWLWKRKPSVKEYKELDLRREVKLKYKELIDSISSKKIKKKIKWGFQDIGLIGRGALKFWENEEYLILEVYNLNPIGRLKYLFNFRPMYYLIPRKAITETDKAYIISSEYHYDNTIATLNFGRTAREVAKDEAYKIDQEESLKSLINWLPYQAYLSVTHAQSSESLDHLAEIETAKRKATISEMTGKKKT